MKRIVLVMSALATLLVLGVFAIAYAQRGAKDSASDEPPAASPELTPPASSDTKPPVAVTTAEPRLLPPDPHINPLRNPKRAFGSDAIRTAAVGSDDQPIRRSLHTSEISRSDSEDKGFPTRTVVSPTAPVDPFGLRTMAPSGGTRVAGGVSPLTSSVYPSDKKALALDGATSSTGHVTPAGMGAKAAASPRSESSAGRIGDSEADASSVFAGPALKGPALEPRGSSLRGSANPRPLTNEFAAKPLREPRLNGAGSSRADTPGSRSAPAGEPALLIPGASSINPVPGRASAEVGSGRSVPVTEPGASDPGRTETGRAGEGTGRPGAKQFDGPQAPQLTIQKIAPPEIQVGKPATFQIKLKNTGPVPAHSVELHDVVPKGTRLIRTSPQANPGVRGELVWQLGTLKPGDDIALEVQLMPTEEGEIGSVATVSFSADATTRTIATRPQLVVKVAAPTKVLIGEDVTLAITLTNAGSGIARKVVLDERVPPNLQHVTGRDLEYEVGDLKPNETRQVELKLTAVQPGPTTNLLVARGDANVKVEERWDLEVLAPQLELGLEGPKRRFLDREASYKFSVSNPGTAPARQVELVAQLPPGLKFVRANNSGAYDDATRSVRWLLEELPVKETGTVELTTVAVNIGEERLRIRGTAEKGIAAEKEHPVIIDGIAAVMFEVVDTRDPVEVNGETTYEIRVLNQGSKESTNVQISVTLPPDLKFVAAEGSSQHANEGNRVVFQPLPRLAAKADTTYRVRVQGLKPGDQRVRVQLLTDEIREPITKEESTRVYSDN